MSVTQRAWRTMPDPAKNAAKAMWLGYARLTNRARLLPDFLVIGTQRGGTTSLYKYLVQHPNLAHALTKEIRFFDLNYQRGMAWYRSRFPSRRHREAVRRRRGLDLVVGEASPDYLFHPHAPVRVARDLPDVKLIVLLRDPVDRAFSHYWHQFKRGHEQLSFPEAVAAEPRRLAGELEKTMADPSYVSYERHHHSYVARGVYADQMAAWMELIPRERFLVERSEDFFLQPRLVYQRVLEFLGLPDHDLPEYETFNAFSSGEMDPAVRAGLVEYFRPHNRRLYDYLDRDFGWDA
jgi:sulfotransferase family protein